MSTISARDTLPGWRRPLEILSPSRNIAGLVDVARRVGSMRDLLAELVRRDISAAHAAQGLGPAWVYIHPIVIVVVYVFVIGFVIGSKIQATASFPGDYPSYILVGL